MKQLTLLFLFSQTFISNLQGQHSADTHLLTNHLPVSYSKPSVPLAPAEEICDNGIDDNNNGLADIKDFTCFFNTIPSDTCYQTKMLWALFNFKLFWIDLETNNYRIINFPNNALYYDIAWSPDGKLYGVDRDRKELVEIDPNTGQSQTRYSLTGYLSYNGMVSDAAGNMYLSSFSATGWYITKFNFATGQLTRIANLGTQNLISAGDLSFVNGMLYLSCTDNKIAKIDVFNGSIEAFDVNGPYADGQGLTTFGDGYLYVSGTNFINRIDPATMTSTLYYTFPVFGMINGLTSYSEFCNAPGCKARLDDIAIKSDPPYCSSSGVKLKGNGRGIMPAPVYTWTLPDGTIANGDALTAYMSGTYTLRYHSSPDTCGVEKSITLDITTFPAATLGKDTLLCSGAAPIVLQPKDTTDVTAYVWQNGATGNNFTAVQPGIYWVKTSNACGVKTDSIEVLQGVPPQVNITGERLICPGNTLTLANQFPRKSDDKYLWSTNEKTESITISETGTYWLEGTNACGSKRDSITVIENDSCICNPLYPKVNLGEDIELCDNDKKTISNRLNQTGFFNTWQDGSHTNEFIITKPGTYWLNVYTPCGEVRDSINVTRKTDGCTCTVYFPKAFTPAVNVNNDFFKPLSECSIAGTMQIYNRYGQLVYETNDLQKGWNGSYKGSLQPTGGYVYNVRYKYLSKPGVYNAHGSFLLLR